MDSEMDNSIEAVVTRRHDYMT